MSNFYVNSVKRKMKFQKLDLQSMQNNDEDSLSNSAKDLTGFTGSCKMQRTLNLGSLTAFNLSFTNRALGKLRISLTNAQTANIEEGKYFYELMLTDSGGVVERVIEGQVIVKHPVTWDSPTPLTPFVPQVP